MKKKSLSECRADSGVALIIVLGLLAVLTILAVFFAIAMRVEWLAARNHANSVRAEALIHVGVNKAMTEINISMAGKCYPNWSGSPASPAHPDSMCSYATSGEQISNILDGEASNAIPRPLLAAAQILTSSCYWTNIVSGGMTNGRIAYIVVNASGLMDANYVCAGKTRESSTNVGEINVTPLLAAGKTTNDFITQRAQHKRYENPTELVKLNNATPANEGFSAYSYDPDRDVYFTNTTELGQPNANLIRKFDLNLLSTFECSRKPGVYSAYTDDGDFMTRYYWPLVAILKTPRAVPYYGTNTLDMVVERPEDVAWNIINYLDADRLPQCAFGGTPWMSSEGGEAIPLINEIALEEVSGVPDGKPLTSSNWYQFAVEVWYPFAPMPVTAADGFKIEVGVFTNNWFKNCNAPAEYCRKEVRDAPDADCIMDSKCNEYSINFADINNMVFGSASAFVVVRTPPFAFPEPATGVTNWIKIGTSGLDGVKRQVWFLARMHKVDLLDTGYYRTNIVDEAMGYLRTNEIAGITHKRALKAFDSPKGYCVNDPRSNGQVKYWTQNGDLKDPDGAGPLPANGVNIGGKEYTWSASPPFGSDQTLGTTNKNCYPSGGFPAAGYTGMDLPNSTFQGLPIFRRDGPMRNIGELGHIWRSNLEDEMWELNPKKNPNNGWWRTINLTHYDEGALLMDRITVRCPTNGPLASRGLFAISSRQTNALASLFSGVEIGYSNDMRKVTDDKIANLVNVLTNRGPYISWRSMFSTGENGGPVAVAIRDCGLGVAPNGGDIYCEDMVRKICELVSFRQNIFVIIVAAQVFAPESNVVVGEKRAAVTVYRDSYTSRYFIRSFKWLSDR